MTSDTVYMWYLYIWYGLHVMFVHLIRFTCDVCTSDTVYMWRLYIWYGLHVTFVHLIRFTCDVCTSDMVYMWRLYIWYGLHVTFVHLIRFTCDKSKCWETDLITKNVDKTITSVRKQMCVYHLSVSQIVASIWIPLKWWGQTSFMSPNPNKIPYEKTLPLPLRKKPNKQTTKPCNLHCKQIYFLK
jgi:hypothetical protein